MYEINFSDSQVEEVEEVEVEEVEKSFWLL